MVRMVPLRASNQIAVEVRGKPGGKLIVGITGLDNDLPGISATVTPPPNANGWNNTDVTVSFACTDAFSGVASCTAPVKVTSEGAHQVVTGTVIDRAGNARTTS